MINGFFLGGDYPKLFFFFSSTVFPSTLFLGYYLESLLFKAVCSQFSFVIRTWEKFLLITLLDLCYVFVFLGFLTLLANFGLVAPIPDGIRVLGVETPLRT